LKNKNDEMDFFLNFLKVEILFNLIKIYRNLNHMG